MATANPFDLLGDDDNDDVSHLIAIPQKKKATAASPAPAVAKQPAKPAKLPSKPAPPAQAGETPDFVLRYFINAYMFVLQLLFDEFVVYVVLSCFEYK